MNSIKCHFLFIYILFQQTSFVFVRGNEEKSSILSLSFEDLDERINMKSDSNLLVMFYASWCGHCKVMGPVFEDSSKNVTFDLTFAKLEVVDDNSMAAKYNVKSFPHIQLFQNGLPSYIYRGPTNKKDFTSWIMRMVGDPTTPLTSLQELKTLELKHEIILLAVLPEDLSDIALGNFHHLCRESNSVLCLLVDSSEIEEYFEMSERTGLVLLRYFTDEPVFYRGDLLDYQDMKSWISIHFFLPINKLTTEFLPKLSQNTRKYLFFFMTTEYNNKNYEKEMSILHEACTSYLQDILFIVVDVKTFVSQKFVKFFGESKDSIPYFGLVQRENNVKWLFSNKTLLSSNGIKAFVNSVLSGDLEPTLNSAPLSEDWNTGPVKKLVSSNMKGIALDTKLTVFILFYSPSCSHCKKWFDIWKQLGEYFEKRKEDNVIIAQMDATENEIDLFELTQYPTIKLITKINNKIFDYQGEKTLDSLINFIRTSQEYVHSEL